MFTGCGVDQILQHLEPPPPPPPPPAQKNQAPKQEPVIPHEVSRYPKIDPSSVTPLEIVVVGEPVGEGYPRVPIRMSKPLYSDKWLGLANGDAQFMGPRHIIVNRFRSRPDNLGEGDLLGNVLLDVETGEVVAKFRYGRYVQWERGLAIVYKHGEDDRPYLLDAATGTFVLAVPEGSHQYVNRENYHLRFSAIGPYIWITATDLDGTIHLSAWDKLDAPPELPNNPFPFEPKWWNPLDFKQNDGDTEEVGIDTEEPGKDNCTRALLIPPKGWVCLDAEDVEDSEPLSEGWRVKGRDVFNRDDGRGFDLSSLCPEGQTISINVRRRSPPQADVFCQADRENPTAWVLWTPPDRVRKVEPRYALRNEPHLLYDSERDRFLVSPYHEQLTYFDPESETNHSVGTNTSSCPNLDFLPGNNHFASVAICTTDRREPLWSELHTNVHQLRSNRFKASVVVAGPSGLGAAIIRKGTRDHVVRIWLDTQ
jgi:hypothetical protein